MITDSHCHLDYFEGEEQAAVLARARAAGVGFILGLLATRR